MSISAPPPPPLLLTKRVTSFLHANLSSHIHTAALTTPGGKLLAHASSEPASVLRRQCAVAASLWALHSPETSGFQESVEAALPSNPSSSGSGRTGESSSRAKAVTVQLDSGGVFVIRHLQCGMLFVCVGASDGAAAAAVAAPRGAQGQAHAYGQHGAAANAEGNGTATISPPLGSPSEAASFMSAGTTGAATVTSHTTTGSMAVGASPAAVLAMRRQVEDLAKWLDDKLGSLLVPEEGIGYAP